MIFLLVVSSVICALSGLLIKYLTDKKHIEFDITWMEYAVTTVCMLVVILPLISIIGWKSAVNNRISFEENINGWETEAQLLTTQCHRDGICHWTYECDPYIVMVTYTYTCGKSTCMGVRAETHYHSCPYVTEEWSQYVNTTLGQFTIDQHRFPEHYTNWRDGHDASRVARIAGVGYHPSWLAAKLRLDSMSPGPVTIRQNYQNFLYASDYTILKEASQDVETYKHSLPALNNNIEDFYYENRAIAVNERIHNMHDWNTRLAYLNAELGNGRHGDLRVVIVRYRAASPDAYKRAVQSYWQNERYQHRGALGKNSMVVVLGTINDSTVEWARAFSAMPLGNEAFMNLVRTDFVGKRLHPDTIIGIVSHVNNRLVIQHGLAEMLLVNPITKYQRQDMSQFAYLKREISPSPSMLTFLYTSTIFLSIGCWIVSIMHGQRFPNRYQSFSNTYYSR